MKMLQKDLMKELRFAPERSDERIEIVSKRSEESVELLVKNTSCEYDGTDGYDGEKIV